MPDESRLERLRARVRELPDGPGVYLHKNAAGEVIYVGKARSLRNRVSSYLTGVASQALRTWALVQEIDSIDFVATHNELEAILLENNLIKQHQPRFNVNLRDDKTYPYLKVTLSEDYPRVVFTRRVDRRRGDLYFGPFFAGSARRVIKLVADWFNLRSCDLVIRDGENALPRPCLYYDMKKCPGPCVTGLVTREAYRAMVDDVVLFLGGKDRELKASLSEKMHEAADREVYELATHYRDLLRTTEKIQAEQKVAASSRAEADVWGFHEEAGNVAVQVFITRDGNMVDRRELFWEQVEDYSAPYFLSQVLQRYYEGNLFIPSEVHVPFDVDDQDLLEAWLSQQAGRKVTLRVPVRGRGADFASLANRNARMAHELRFRRSRHARDQEAAERLGQLLGHPSVVKRIESFDISNIQGSDSVAAMVVLDSGKFAKDQYRVFNIRSVVGADDFRSMAEAVGRRYRRLKEEGKPLPDLILIDGGRGQLNAAMAALEAIGIEGPSVAGLAKREEQIYLPSTEEPVSLTRQDPVLQLLQKVRDETHRFAVSSHRKRRSKRTLHSGLDDLAGVGAVRRKLLIEHFGSLSAVRQASVQDLVRLLGKTVGKSVHDQLHGAGG